MSDSEVPRVSGKPAGGNTVPDGTYSQQELHDQKAMHITDKYYKELCDLKDFIGPLTELVQQLVQLTGEGLRESQTFRQAQEETIGELKSMTRDLKDAAEDLKGAVRENTDRQPRQQ